MKRALLILLLLAGCASGAQDDPNVTVHLAQYQSAPNAYLFGGPVNITFAVSIMNGTKEKLTLNRIEIRTVGSGAYTIRPTSTSMNIELSPGESRTMPISLWGSAPGGRLAAEEPVNVRAIGYFTGPSGSFVRFVTEYIPQQQ